MVKPSTENVTPPISAIGSTNNAPITEMPFGPIAIEPPPSTSVIGRDTVSQMQIGIYWGYVGMIEGMIARMKAEIGRPVKVIATGGLAPLFQQHGYLFDRVEPDLTLRGIALLYANRTMES